MKTFYLFLLSIALVTGLQSQSTFHKSFGIPGNGGSLYRSLRTSDGSFVSVGRMSNNTSFDGDFLVMKTEAAGNPSWIKKFATPDFEEFTDVAETADGGVVAVGSSSNMTTYLSSAVLKKLNAAGVTQWTKTYSISGHSVSAHNIRRDNSGNLFVLGTVNTDGSSDDYLILKLDGSGNVLTQTTFSTPDFDFPLAFVRKGNGDMFICGWDNTFVGENIHLLKVNADMTLAWNKKISGPVRFFAYDMKERADGHLALAGRYDDGGSSYDILICTIDDSNGEQVWAKSYSATEDFGTYAYGLTISQGDVIAVTGPAETSSQGTFLLATDATGNLNWSYRYGEPGATSEGYGVTTASDGGYLLCGLYSNSSDAIVQLLKTNSTGYLACNSSAYSLAVTPVTLPMQSLTVATGTTNLTAQDLTLTETAYSNLATICLGTGITETAGSAFTVSPNPSDGRFTLKVPGTYAGAQVTLVNTSGTELLKESLPSGSAKSSISKTIDIEAPDGIYIVKIDDGKQQVTRKVCISR